jgi:hypothetical protein
VPLGIVFLLGDARKVVGDQIDGVLARAFLLVAVLTHAAAHMDQVANTIMSDSLTGLSKEGDAVEMGIVLPLIAILALAAVIGGNIDANSRAGRVDSRNVCSGISRHPLLQGALGTLRPHSCQTGLRRRRLAIAIVAGAGVASN